MTAPTDEEYRRLLAFRTELRRFIRWSETAAADAGLTPALHQLLLAIRGHDDATGPATIGSVAEALLVRHHTAVELAQRAEQEGLIVRRRDEDDQRRVLLALTRRGAARLDRLSEMHLEQIGGLAERLTAVTARR
ncbi:winged helix-turn-helix transcriptional regulator [Baekduia soli]|uniref:Winged helix-turn-helix transcriptional regulator n=1 Tax=Baekduia soli TaxID=496014 RepID=A0A5B8U0C7_9ACTN|nr:MarR family winged helix-turn-helix transcriptional regulator [Baekduia soli]QEC46412.1 winged helix-turn-helix transcriptional regulator [Baekduia soli]